MQNEFKELQFGNCQPAYKANALSKHGNFGVLPGPKGVHCLMHVVQMIWVGDGMASFLTK
jgi:hypothetical protein